jgi:hypothetical protein
MEKRTIRIICRLCVGLTAFALTAMIANAQNLLLNPGFETSTDGVNATSWIQFGGATLSSTNNSSLTVHSGLYSMNCPTPGIGLTPIGAGAYQDVATGGSNLRLTGYWFAWQNARPVGPDRFAVAQLAFMDSTGGTGNVLQLNESLHYGITGPLPINTWTPFEVDATNAPAGTTKVRVFVMYVGDSQDSGNFFFDDLTLYTLTGSSTAQGVISQPAVQVLFPTSTPTNEVDYQVQSITNLVFTLQAAGASNVLVNPGFEANAITNDPNCPDYITPITGWTLGGVGSYGSVNIGDPPANPCLAAHSGIGALSEIANENPPVVYQSIPATPGQVWTFTGYGYVCESICGVTPSADCRGLLKVVWNDSGGNALPPLVDTNFVGALDTAPYYGITSSPQMGASSQPDTWTLLECQGTAPAGTASVVFYNITVGSSGQILFDDDFATLATAPLGGWQNLGPVWLANGLTNQVFDTVTTSQKFYRVTTP